ncbi:CCCH zinc finger and RRM domain protein [Aspergillus homomorphus CBS 101889]|uniref:CCCH zinc finger and RRM domain protein n=1 Tax=Aspergillus homomorphus (strain CBS 101889) TaxID=1450537 RepID=A0A395I1I0_ASPHC|nr:hypothetical protein BO97DRAFT_387689 [Aspergillus homomorphus CBS 101889]RAL13777.1 hypothetical protein BO97DRAFT_387689 [Aspergillus homomorphus CBS 101889]
MQLTENEAGEVKKWVVRKLEDISDADSDVLADYVLALIRTDAPDEDIRKASVDNLEDFLREHTVKFVDELFTTFASKPQPAAAAGAAAAQPSSYAQGQSQDSQTAAATGSAPQNQQHQQQNAFNPSTGPSKGPYGAPQMGNFPQQQAPGDNQHNFNRKRTFQEGFQMDVDRDDVPQNRNYKTPRRGRGGGRGDWMGGRDGRAGPGGPGPQQAFNPQAAPFMPPTFPPFDQNDPMAAMMALQSMGFPQMPGMPPMPMPPPGAGQQPGEMPKSSERCPFYETQGICYLGNTCPYQHDNMGGASKEDEYDPKSSSIVTDYQRRSDGPPMRGGDRGRGRGRGGDRGGFGGRGRRSEFSSAGPNEDTSITTIVVEQIPDDKLDEATVRDFFSQYGEIVDISLQPHRRLALINYENHAAAKSAWSSPKVIFDNRFVKVYWHKPKGERNGDSRPHHHHAAGGGDSEGPAFNREEFEKQQEEAQRTYEEKLKKRKETEEAKQALERQRDELLKKQQEERQRLMQRLGGGASSSNGDASAGGGGSGGGAASDGGDGRSPSAQPEHVSEQTKQLRAQLAALEAEAKSLGIDPSASAGPGGYRGRGRGGFGRGGYAPRGRGGGYDASSSSSSYYRGGGGGYRGRGGMAGRGGVLRLDNRPKRVAVSGVEFNSEKDEALRQFLIGVGEYSSIEPNPDQPDSLIVAFKERYQAEKFMFGPRDIPSVGQVELAWVPNPPISLPQQSAAGSTGGPGSDTKTGSDEDTLMDTPPAPSEQNSGRKDGGGGGGHDVDYDVAEMDDSWGVE